MRTFLFRAVVCLSLAAVASSSGSAGVRGKPSKLKSLAPSVAASRVAQNTNDYSKTPVAPVPLPMESTNSAETIVNESVIEDSDCTNTASASAPVVATHGQANVVVVAVPMMVPMVAPTVMATPIMSAPLCATYGGGMGGGLTPAAAAAYGQAFPNGYYRSGAEAGMYHFPYYSYRRPWYFPGQPSFHRSTDLVW